MYFRRKEMDNRVNDENHIKANEERCDLLKYVPKDRGWGWMCVLGGFLMTMLNFGLAVKSFGILFVEFIETFNSSSATTSWVQAVFQGCSLTAASFASTLAEHFNARKVVLVGGFLTALGMALGTVAPNIEFLFFSHGVLIGAGTGLSYSPSIVHVGKYFKKRRALATGLCVAGSGVGTIVFPPILRLLLDHYRLRGTLLILSGLLLHILVCGMLLRPLSFYLPNRLLSGTDLRPIVTDKYAVDTETQTGRKATTNQGEFNVSQTSSNVPSLDKVAPCQNCIRSWFVCFRCCKTLSCSKFDWSLLKNTSFLVFGISFFFFYSAYPPFFMMLPSHCKKIGISKRDAAYLITIIGVLDLFCRVFFGWLSDFNFVKKHYIYSFSVFISGCSCFAIPFMTHFASLAVICSVFALFAGSYFALNAPMLIDNLGIERLPSAFGLAMIMQGLASLFAPPVIGLLEDVTGEWTWSFVFAGVSMFLAGVIPLFVSVIKRRVQI